MYLTISIICVRLVLKDASEECKTQQAKTSEKTGSIQSLKRGHNYNTILDEEE